MPEANCMNECNLKRVNGGVIQNKKENLIAAFVICMSGSGEHQFHECDAMIKAMVFGDGRHICSFTGRWHKLRLWRNPRKNSAKGYRTQM